MANPIFLSFELRFVISDFAQKNPEHQILTRLYVRKNVGMLLRVKELFETY